MEPTKRLTPGGLIIIDDSHRMSTRPPTPRKRNERHAHSIARTAAAHATAARTDLRGAAVLTRLNRSCDLPVSPT